MDQTLEQLQRLQRITASFVAAQTPADVRQVILGELVEVLGASVAALRLVDGERLVLEQHLESAVFGEQYTRRYGVLERDTQHPAAEALRSGTAVFIGTAGEHRTRYPLLAEAPPHGAVEASAHLPLLRGAEVFGVLSMAFGEPQRWDADQRAFALTLTDRAALAYERARLFQAERRARRQSERLQAVTVALSRATTPAAVYDAVLQHGVGVSNVSDDDHALGARSATLFLVAGDVLELAGSTGAVPELLESYRRIPSNAPIPAAEAVRSATPIWISSKAEFRRRYPHLQPDIERLPGEAAASVPVMFEGRVLGGLNFTFTEKLAFDADDRRFLLALADQAAHALERSRLFTDLQASEERYRELLATIDQGFCVLEMLYDADGTAVDYRFLEVNTTFEHHTGLTDPVGHTARELVPGLEQHWIATYNQVATSGEPLRFEQHSTAMGRWFAVNAVRVGGPQSRKVALLFTDITARRELEQEQARVRAALSASETRLRALYAEEQRARAQAEEASRLKDEFLATVSHELRTPLTAFLGYAQLLQTRKRDEAYLARTLDKMVQSARAQAQLIEDLLDVSRIVTGKLWLERAPIDLVAVIGAALDTIRPAIEAKEQHLDVSLDPAAAAVLGDANRLQQVVWNLVSNATKFTPAGGALAIRLVRQGNQAAISVSDTGQGINPAFLPYVFDRFRQADSTSTRAFGGLGLGLAIVRHLVELHGGTVQAASAGEGRGATFTVFLPLATAPGIEATEKQAPSDHCPPELAGLKVLIVDDQIAILELIHDILAPLWRPDPACSRSARGVGTAGGVAAGRADLGHRHAAA
jgi:signal transduction histidine kinase/GAF domain-containing protein